MRTMTTLVALVGTGAAGVLGRVSAANVSTELAGDVPAEPPARAAHMEQVWRRAVRRSSVYTLVDADPLGGVVEAWARRLVGGRDDLELVIGLTTDAPAPDYYFVDPGLPEPAIHWYVGFLRAQAPRRVVIGDLRPAVILDALSALPYGIGLPGLAELARAARSYVPLPEPDQPLTTPRGRSRATGAARAARLQASTTASTSL